MSLRFHPLLLLSAACGAFFASLAGAQSAPDLVTPKIRETLVADAERVAGSRGAPVQLPNPLPNPFVAIAPEAELEAPSDEANSEPTEVIPPLKGLELLQRIATEIPATGTMIVAEEPILLLGQKKLKVGDTHTISLDGQSYDVSIDAISPTSFTVKRGELRFSRPTRLNPAPSSPPPSRP